jgi:uncharacterized protein
MRCLDTSVLIAAITTETTTSAVLDWIGQQLPASLAISGWSITELHSALALKQRTGQIDSSERRIAHNSFDKLLRPNLIMLPIPGDSFTQAARLIDEATSLRASDALHLAIIRHHGIELVTLDQAFAREAVVLGTVAISPEN